MGQRFSEMFPSKPTWTTADIPDLTGKVALVTGGNTGIGKETVKALLEHNATVYLAARTPEKAERAIADLKTTTGREAHFLKLDLANLRAVKEAAEDFLSKEIRLDILFNSAGVMMCPVQECTADGYDLQFGTNVLGHFYLTKLLLPALLAKSSNSAANEPSRVVTTSSIGHNPGRLDFATFKDGPKRRKAWTQTLYFQSKLGNIVFANELARRYGDQGLVSTSVNPGNLDSDLYRYMPRFLHSLVQLSLYPCSFGALTQLYAGTAPEAVEVLHPVGPPWKACEGRA